MDRVKIKNFHEPFWELYKSSIRVTDEFREFVNPYPRVKYSDDVYGFIRHYVPVTTQDPYCFYKSYSEFFASVWDEVNARCENTYGVCCQVQDQMQTLW